MTRNIVFIAPFPTQVTQRFVRAASKLPGTRLLGVVHTLSADAAELYDDVVRVERPTSLDDLSRAVEILRQRHGEPDRIVGILEAMMVELAALRERFGVRGTPVKTANLFRDKAAMKDALRAAGLPVARHCLVRSVREAMAFADQVGFPIVVKPPAGMGAKATFRVENTADLARAVQRATAATPILAEEMLRGTEHSFETITLGGKPRAWSFSNYAPGPLEVLETPWIQWACVLPREIDTPVFDKAKAMGFEAIRVLGLEDGMTHMEWYQRADGSLAIGEIAQRPPGPQLLQMTGVVNGIDPYRAWARAVIDEELDAPWERRSAAGCAYVRGMGQGRVAAVTGVRETSAHVGAHLVEAKLPTVGAWKNDSYEGDGYVVVRHDETREVEALVRKVVTTLRVHYA